jgi:hypothetical protein
MSSWARPGVKCVFVGVPSWAKPDWRGIAAPSLHHVYTIRDVVLYEGSVLVRLAEIVNPVIDLDNGRAERCYPLICFRPLISKTQEQDVELFRHHLTGAPVGEPV